MPFSEELSSLVEGYNPWWRDKLPQLLPFIHRRDRFEDLLGYVGQEQGVRAALLVGPRQVGKTTLLLQVASRLLELGWPPGNVTFFDFSDDRLLRPLSPRDITEIRPPGAREDRPRVFLFDEIQEAIHWQRWLKVAVDGSRRAAPSSRNVFIATGSSAASLKDGGVESGQGRWDDIPIEGLTYREFLRMASRNGETLDDVLDRDPGLFERYLLMGGFPEHVFPSGRQDPLPRIRQDIIERAILRDLRRTGVDIDKVKRLFTYLVGGSGQIWDAKNRSSDLEANRKSVEAWREILEATHLLRELEDDRIHRGKAVDNLRAQPKIYAADHGLITALSALPDPMDDSGVRAKVFEATVFRHLRGVASGTKGHLTYFRRRERGRDGDLEIDFIFRRSRGHSVAIEVTNSREVRSEKVERLRRAATLAEIDRRIIVGGGMARGTNGDVQFVPLHAFLRNTEQFVEGES